MTREDYCSFEVSKLLKEKGFPFMCNVGSLWVDKQGKTKLHNSFAPITWVNEDDPDTPCVTQALAMKWLREVHKVLIVIDAYHADHWEGYIDSFEIRIYTHASTIIVPNEITHHTDYTKAVEAALKYCLTELI